MDPDYYRHVVAIIIICSMLMSWFVYRHLFIDNELVCHVIITTLWDKSMIGLIPVARADALDWLRPVYVDTTSSRIVSLCTE